MRQEEKSRKAQERVARRGQKVYLLLEEFGGKMYSIHTARQLAIQGKVDMSYITHITESM